MNFDLDKSIALLERGPKVYKSLFYGLGFDWTSINEGEDTWSAFDILGHLIEGEKSDWIPRARIILSKDGAKTTFEPFDRFAQEKATAGKRMDDLLDEFDHLRQDNLGTLRSWNLSDSDLEKTAIHPGHGSVTLRQHLSTWTVHDVNHLHQISRVMVKHYREDIGPWKKYLRIFGGK